MENEAHEARGRWPLLGMIDPRKVELSAADAARGRAPVDPAAEPDAPQAHEVAASGITVPGPARAGGGLLPRDRSQAALRRSAPLFTRSPRRDIPPVIEKALPKPPESGAFRFSPVPAAAKRIDEAVQEEPVEAAAPAPVPQMPRVAPRGTALPPLTANLPRAANVASAPSAVASAPAQQDRPSAEPSRSAPLKKLFGATTPAAAPSGSAAAIQKQARLDTLFDRLRSGNSGNSGGQAGRVQAQTAAEPKPSAVPRRPWFLKGVSGP